jgi:hypothetical protein
MEHISKKPGEKRKCSKCGKDAFNFQWAGFDIILTCVNCGQMAQIPVN